MLCRFYCISNVYFEFCGYVCATCIMMSLFLLQFFGGTNFGRTAGGPLQITSYDYDAPIDEYGM